ATAVVAMLFGVEVRPQLDDGVLWRRANFPAIISLEKSAQMASAVRDLVKQSPEVGLVTSQTGRNDAGTDPSGPNRNEFFVASTPYETWTSGKGKAVLVRELSGPL